jgi:phosphoketolase
VEASEAVRGMSGAFATRTLSNTQEVITELTKQREELRAYVEREGNDPPEILEWTWSRNGANPS